MSPLSVTGYGTVEERIDEGHEIEEHEYELIKKNVLKASAISK